mgnify:FL=1
MDKLITILGPTAVGKTNLTLRLAKTFGSSVISGDAYQVYRGLDIGSAKPSKEELAAVPHYLIDILEPHEAYSTALFQDQAQAIIKALNDKGQVPILSGGTGLYVQSLLENYQFSKKDPNVSLRQSLDRLYEEGGIEALRTYGDALAAKGHISLNFRDKHRLYRAIELMEVGDYQALTQQTKEGLSYQGPVLGLRRDRKSLYDRINLRVDLMIQAGLFQEVEALLDAGLDKKVQSLKGIGYKEVLDYLMGDLSQEACIETIKQNTRRFAKRQMTWYKRMPYIQWIDIEEGMTDDDIYNLALPMVEPLMK